MTVLPIKKFAVISPLLFLGCASLINPIDNPPVITLYTITSCSAYGAYDGTEGNVTISYKYKYTGLQKYSDVKEILYVYSNDVLVSRSSTSIHELNYEDVISVNLTFSPYKFKSVNTLDFSFQIVKDGETPSILKSYNFALAKKVSKTIKTSDIGVSNYSISGTTFNLKTTDYLLTETFNFSKLMDYFSCDEYYTLPLDNLYFSYSYSNKITYKSAYLKFEDPEELFPYINIDSDGFKRVPISLNQSMSFVSFSFKTMYVKGETLEMSNDYRVGFYKTKKFYLPLRKANELDEMTFYLELNGLGANETNVIHQMTYYSTPNLFGSCSTSDYCVHGGNNP